MSYSQDVQVLDAVIGDQKAERGPELTVDRFFEHFAIGLVLRGYDLGDDEIESGITDGFGDGGVDAIYTFVNGATIGPGADLSAYRRDITIDLRIFQAKNTTSFQEVPLLWLKDAAHKLFGFGDPGTGALDEFNAAVREQAGIFRSTFRELVGRKPQLRIHIHYVTRGDDPAAGPTERAKEVEAAFKALYSQAAVQVEFVGASKLYQVFNEPAHGPIPLPAVNSILSTVDNAYVCAVRIKDFVEQVTDGNGGVRAELCDQNVRDFQGKTEVNEQIMKTLTGSELLDFWCMNNGITITADSVSITGTTLHVSGLQIVNGLQTSHQLCAYGLANPQALAADNRTVMIRVIVPPSDEYRDAVIRATNSQTSVGAASLRATDPIHRRIETHLRQHGIFYERRKNQYRNQSKPLDSILSIQSLGQGLAAMVLREPHRARGKPSSLLKDDKVYERLFDSSLPMDTFLSVARAVIGLNRVYRDAAITEFRSDKRYLMWHSAMHFVMTSTGTTYPSPTQIANIDDQAFSTADLVGSLTAVDEELSTAPAPPEEAKLKSSTEKVVASLSPNDQGMVQSTLEIA